MKGLRFDWYHVTEAEFIDELAVTVMEDLADLLKIKRESMYQQIYNGKLDIPHVKRGKKYLFPAHEVAVYLDANLDETRI